MAYPTTQEALAELATYRARIDQAQAKLATLGQAWGRKARAKQRALEGEIEHVRGLIRIIERYLRGEPV